MRKFSTKLFSRDDDVHVSTLYQHEFL